jgi:hypothetical protein
MFLWQPAKALWAAVGSAAAFGLANLGVGAYVLVNITDPRWSAGGADILQAPRLADTPLIGRFMGSFDSLMGSVVGGVNEFLEFKDALPAAVDFFGRAGWAFLAMLPLFVLAVLVSAVQDRRRKAEYRRYKAAVGELQRELAELKKYVNYPASGATAAPGQAGDT